MTDHGGACNSRQELDCKLLYIRHKRKYTPLFCIIIILIIAPSTGFVGICCICMRLISRLNHHLIRLIHRGARDMDKSTGKPRNVREHGIGWISSLPLHRSSSSLNTATSKSPIQLRSMRQKGTKGTLSEITATVEESVQKGRRGEGNCAFELDALKQVGITVLLPTPKQT